MKRMILAATALAVVACAGVAGAYLTGQAQVPDNVITVGTVAVSTEPTSSALSFAALAPGVVETRVLTVVNAGTLPMRFVVSGAKKSGATGLYGALWCRASEGSGTVLYAGSLKELRTTPVTLQPGASTRLKMLVGLPADTGNDLAGDSVKLSLYVDAEQVR